MSLKEKIEQDFKSAFKAKQEIDIRTLRMLKAAITNKEKSRPLSAGPLADEEIGEVILSEVKKRKEALAIYQNAGRQDLASKEKEELGVLQRYLPAQLSDQELFQMIDRAIEQTKANSPKDIGRIMAWLMPLVKGRADGARVSKAVKDKLS